MRMHMRALAVAWAVALALAASAGPGARPARALIAPRAEVGWRLGYAWAFSESAHGLDWGVSVRMPFQRSELGLVQLVATLEGTGPGYRVGDWAFHMGALVFPARRGQPEYGLFYALRGTGEALRPANSSLTGLAFRYGPLRVGFFPGSWNPGAMSPQDMVAVLEPGWFSGLFVQLRWLSLPGHSSVRLAFGIEEGW